MAKKSDILEIDEQGTARCRWCVADPLYIEYHDTEWGHPTADDNRLFEKICLEGFQAGLSWLTILRKRAEFRRSMHGFDFRAIARYNERSVERLLGNAGIIRHRGKIESAVNNARRAIELVEEFGSIGAFLWQFESPRKTAPKRMADIPAQSPESVELSRQLKKRGWTFVGPTTMYAMMQCMGLVNDHGEGCSARASAERVKKAFKRPKCR